jgi:hypothetical protein
VWETALREALADGVFTPEERARLGDMAAALGIKEEQRTRIFAGAAKEAVESAYAEALADNRMRPGEEEKLADLAASLGVNVQLAAGMADRVARARLLAQIEEGLLPSVATPILLTRGETCHFTAPVVKHSEMRVVTKRVNYSGPVASIRIMKGLRWRVGSISAHRVTQDVLTHVDTGALYITNKKLFFQGGRKNTSIALSKIVQFKVYKDGLEIDKQTGKDFYCIGEADWELAGACLDAATKSLQ